MNDLNSKGHSGTVVRWGMALMLAAALVAAGVGLASDKIPTATAQSEGVSLTVYNQNLALVKDVRSQTLEAGLNQLRFTDIASQIDPTSVLFRSLTDPAGTRVLEQNYEYDLVSTGKLLQKYVDEQVGLIIEDGTEYSGTLLSAGDDIILQSEDGSVSVVKGSGIREVNFPELPGGLITKPSLVWMLDAAEAGDHDIEVTYLTHGINWNADYVLELATDDASVNLNGWITLDNRSGATYENAALKLVAGDIHRVEEPEFRVELEMVAMPKAAPMPQVEEREFFEYHLYDVQRPVTVRDNQTKQIEFVSASDVEATKEFVYASVPSYYFGGRGFITDPGYGLGFDAKVMVRLKFENSEEAGLGIALPKGRVRVYKADTDGSTQFVGEDSIDHTPKDETIDLLLGNAFDVVGERVQTDFTVLGPNTIEESFTITLRNHKSEDITVRVVEHLYRWHDWEIIEESAEHTDVDAFTIEWKVSVPQDDETSISYTVRYRSQ